jgi:predicted ATP-dependent endonuclease of OLD family
MHIRFVELQNFRKLKAIHVNFAETTTVFVGANNSGKTSAMVALGHFLVDPDRFCINDFTLSTLSKVNKIGERWVKEQAAEGFKSLLDDWKGVLPTLDVWLDVEENELRHINHLLPSLDWDGGALGVRMRLEPDDCTELCKDYLAAVKSASDTKAAAADKNGSAYTLELWPRNLSDFLDRRLLTYLKIKSYLLDATVCVKPINGSAKPQELPASSEPLDRDPFKGLIRIDEIDAQRGFTDRVAKKGEGETQERQGRKKLTEQLRSYYKKHLDPSELPEPSDLDALQAIDQAQASFDDRLKFAFSSALKEVEELGYPGITDPRLTISTKIRPQDGLDHDAAVQYEVHSQADPSLNIKLKLPEEYNGLGYQNLISIVFRLMSFRDAWMQVGKAEKKAAAGKSEEFVLPPLHLVLVEEPEAHLHAQVQQVFIRKAYDILRKHGALGNNAGFSTQLVVSTHSSHIAHECEFSCLRYFRRLQAREKGDVPTSTVVNLSEVFGSGTETAKFVRRYLKATHCDLFFADAAILVEGTAERMLVPHFIAKHYAFLHARYLTILEIGGSHAKTLRGLIEHLGLLTLVITDLDAGGADGSAVQPAIGAGHTTNNLTLKDWLPGKSAIDELLAATAADKVKRDTDFFAVRVAYQIPISRPNDETALPYTFEDALIFENFETFKTIKGSGLIGKARTAVNSGKTTAEIGAALFTALRSGEKAKFALDLLFNQSPSTLNVPNYIAEGLAWLEAELKQKQIEVIPLAAAAATMGAAT